MLIVLLLFMMTIPPAFGEIEVVYESREKTDDLCEVSSITPIFRGLEDFTVETHINQIVSKYIEDEFNHYLQAFDDSLFCKEGLGEKIHLGEVSHFLSNNLISIAIATVSGGGMHPWYELKTYNFDPHSGNQYSLNELIPDEVLEWLKRKIKQDIEKQYHVRIDDRSTYVKRDFEEHLDTFFSITRREWPASDPGLAVVRFDFPNLLGYTGGGFDSRIRLSELALRLPRDSLLFKLAMEESE